MNKTYFLGSLLLFLTIQPCFADLTTTLTESDYITAELQELQELAEQGDPKAQAHLGYMYYIGEGVKQDYVSAVQWYKKAAILGDKDSQYNLAVASTFGEGIKQDHEEAFYWYQRAAKQNHAISQYNLGISYYYGEGVAQDPIMAFEWFTKAAEQGYQRAQIMLGNLYQTGNGIVKDYEQAALWYRKAADKGNAVAQYNLGTLYRAGNGIKQDYHQAARWFGLSADQGYTEAQNSLTSMEKTIAGASRSTSVPASERKEVSAQIETTPPENTEILSEFVSTLEKTEPEIAEVEVTETEAIEIKKIIESEEVQSSHADIASLINTEDGSTQMEVSAQIETTPPENTEIPSEFVSTLEKTELEIAEVEVTETEAIEIKKIIESEEVQSSHADIASLINTEEGSTQMETASSEHTSPKNTDAPSESILTLATIDLEISKVKTIIEPEEIQPPHADITQYFNTKRGSAQIETALAKDTELLSDSILTLAKIDPEITKVKVIKPAKPRDTRPKRNNAYTLKDGLIIYAEYTNSKQSSDESAVISYAADFAPIKKPLKYLPATESIDVAKTVTESLLTDPINKEVEEDPDLSVDIKNPSDPSEVQHLAIKGNPKAQFYLGNFYHQGKGIKRNYLQAFLWYRRAAKRGNSEAQYNLANMYLMGEGIKQDDYQARLWYEKAAKQGHENAQHNLKELQHIATAQPQEKPEYDPNNNNLKTQEDKILE